MTAVWPHAVATERVRQLPIALKDYTDFQRAVEALKARRPASFDGVWGSACALVAAGLAQQAPGPLLIVLPSERDADDASADLELFTDDEPVFFPSWETGSDERLIHDERFGQRLRILKELAKAQQSTVESRISKLGGSSRSAEQRATGLGQFIKARG